MIPDGLKKYTLLTLEGTPAVLRGILGSYAPNDPIFDLRPDPNRFTVREAMAHIADWDPIFLERMQRTLAEDTPELPNRDEEQLAIDNDYAHQDTLHSITRLKESRPQVVAFLKGLTNEQFERVAIRPELGRLSIAHQMLLMMAHDGYHTRQAAEFVAQG